MVTSPIRQGVRLRHPSAGPILRISAATAMFRFTVKGVVSMSLELVNLVRELIRIESPSGHEGAVSRFCRDWMNRHGFDKTAVDDYGSVTGIIQGDPTGRTILLDGHLDTVEPGDLSRWSRDPFGGELIDGRIHGRGTSDMKGAFGAMMLAASRFAPQRSRLKGNIVVTGSAWEEFFEGYALGKIIERLTREGLRPGLVIIGEASNLTLKIGQRGRAEIVVRTLGKSVHASNPHLGVNAVYSMQAVIEDLRALEPRDDPLLGKGIYEVTDIISSPYPGASVVPAACRITVDRRLLSGETEESVLAPLRDMVKRRKNMDPQFEAEVFIETGSLTRTDGKTEDVKRFFPAWKLEPDNAVVKLGTQALQTVGLPGQVGYYAFCTNGSYSAGIAKIPTLGFGPSQEHLAHVADEYIAVSDLEKACEGYQALIRAYLMD